MLRIYDTANDCERIKSIMRIHFDDEWYDIDLQEYFDYEKSDDSLLC